MGLLLHWNSHWAPRLQSHLLRRRTFCQPVFWDTMVASMSWRVHQLWLESIGEREVGWWVCIGNLAESWGFYILFHLTLMATLSTFYRWNGAWRNGKNLGFGDRQACWNPKLVISELGNKKINLSKPVSLPVRWDHSTDVTELWTVQWDKRK